MIRLGKHLKAAAKDAARVLQTSGKTTQGFKYGAARFAVSNTGPDDPIGRYFGPIELEDKSMWHLFLLENGNGDQ